MSATVERLKRFLKWFLQLPADALIASSTKLPNKILQLAHRSIFLSDGFYPYKPDQQSYIILRNPSTQNLERAGDSRKEQRTLLADERKARRKFHAPGESLTGHIGGSLDATVERRWTLGVTSGLGPRWVYRRVQTGEGDY
jgi:hypothetical protein